VLNKAFIRGGESVIATRRPFLHGLHVVAFERIGSVARQVPAWWVRPSCDRVGGRRLSVVDFFLLLFTYLAPPDCSIDLVDHKGFNKHLVIPPS
jgi:hypothetical protein